MGVYLVAVSSTRFQVQLWYHEQDGETHLFVNVDIRSIVPLSDVLCGFISL